MINLENGIEVFFGRGEERSPSDWQMLAEECYERTIPVFESEECRLGLSMLPALRRLALMYRDGPENIVFSRKEDFLFELKSQGIEPDDSDIIGGLSAIQELCSIYYSLAEEKARRLPLDERPFDFSEIVDISKTIVDRVVWRTMAVETKSPEENAKDLHLKIRGNLWKISQFMLRRKSHRSHPEISLDSLNTERLLAGEGIVDTNDSGISASFENIQFLAGQMTL